MSGHLVESHDEPPIACVGGPYDRWWFDGPGWDSRRRAEWRLWDKRTPITRCTALCYVPTGRTLPNRNPAVPRGAVWQYDPVNALRAIVERRKAGAA